ncbi:unnamed protein product [Dracunculus medinensis]|uniref:Reverse transcriptase domain-containing protein n=1 Tax=Dracunculus medinensis TaxID=318479 RepID=A0A0N4UD93_DRAME|nr:unnamed protein product [Dracunculus medinensis]
MFPNQARFRPELGCADQIFTFKKDVKEEEHCFKYLQPTVTCFIDFAASFDSIDRKALWKVMECDGVPEMIIRLIKAFYEHTSAQVCKYGKLTETPLK